MKIIFLFSALLPSICFGQLPGKDSVWMPFQHFIGHWSGDSEGQPGKGKYLRSYQFIFDGKFIRVTNSSTYPANEHHPQGEVHEDVGYISYDRIRKTFVLRQFHSEGFVNQYRIDSISPDGKTIIFISEALKIFQRAGRSGKLTSSSTRASSMKYSS